MFLVVVVVVAVVVADGDGAVDAVNASVGPGGVLLAAALHAPFRTPSTFGLCAPSNP